MSSSENPKFEPQAPLTAEPPPIPVAPGPEASLAAVSTTPPPVENPVWSGWDLLLIALLTFIAMVVLQIATPVVARWL